MVLTDLPILRADDYQSLARNILFFSSTIITAEMLVVLQMDFERGVLIIIADPTNRLLLSRRYTGSLTDK